MVPVPEKIAVNGEKVNGFSPVSDLEGIENFQTDLRNWRLSADNGRHTWGYKENEEEQTLREKYWLGLPFDMPEMPKPTRPSAALENGWEFLKGLQTEGGNWGANCDGPLFVTSGMVISMYIVGNPIDRYVKLEMCRYLVNTVNEDGGWGTFLDSNSNVFGTSMNYIMLRLLGVSAENDTCVKARGLLAAMGSPLALPTWGKFWLCILGLYEWEGMTPLPPEPLLVPRFVPLNPANWWMPVRNIYISMSYLYGHRFQMREDALIRDIRREIYDLPYRDIHWPSQRSNISPFDRLKPRTLLQSTTASALALHEQWKIPYLRDRALKEVLFQVEAEVHNSNYLCLTPVSWASNMLVLWHAHGPESHWFQGMKVRFDDPMWMCREGLAASGTDGTAVWDTSLSLQAISGTGIELRPENNQVLRDAIEFLNNAQLRENTLGMEHTYRHASRGGWPFSTRDQGYAVSDTTAEALTAVLQLQRTGLVPRRITPDRIKSAVDLLLGMESRGGGFAAYEQVRGPDYLERFNITDMYESCMVESRYPECTGSVMITFSEFTADYPDYRSEAIARCMERSVSYLLKAQYPEGGWLGSWGVCFTYASMFALQGLACAGLSQQNCAAVSNACAFLLRHQNADGGWGESLESSKAKVYVSEPKGSQVPNTAYAVMGLLAAECSDHVAIRNAIAFIMRRQQPTGDWLPGTLEGIYTPPCGYRYPLYKFHFTLKAINQYLERYGDDTISY